MGKLKVFLVCTGLLLTTVAAQAAAPIKIGALFAVSGPAAFLGEPEKNTLEMLVKEIKENLGVTSRVKLVEPKTIQRSEGKAKRVIDNRQW